MKKISFILVFFVFLTSFSFSQVYVNKININNLPNVNFCEMNGFNLTGKVSLDYGQKRIFLKREYITDRKGNALIFNSKMHLVNFMFKNGWELYKYSTDTNYAHFIFKKIETQ